MKHSRLFLLSFLFLNLFSCSENQLDSVQPQSFFPVKNLNGSLIEKLDPDVVTSIHNDLMSKSRLEDAQSFLRTYDENGVIVEDLRNKSDGSVDFSNLKQATTTLMNYGDHVEEIG